MKPRLADRRSRPRFDIVGELSGTLESPMWLPLENIGRDGVLIHSHFALPTGTVHRLTLSGDGHDFTTDVMVRHVTRSTTASGEERYLIGVEFLGQQADFLAEIDRWAMLPAGELPAEL